MTSTKQRTANPWAGIDAALDAWMEQRRELDARLTELLGRPATRDGEPVSRIEVDEHGRLLARLGRAGAVHARDAETLIKRATAAVEARKKLVRAVPALAARWADGEGVR